jgi:alkylated DNA repair dioxygenase AlkB
MATLFPPAAYDQKIASIPGLAYLPEYMTVEEEAALVRQIDAMPWDTNWERRRQSYGATYGPSEGLQRPLPDWGLALAERMHREGLSERPFDQMLVNEYEPGQGIALHHDHKPFDRTVVSLSLLSAVVMDFRNPGAGKRSSMLLGRRSLLILTDEARYIWQHGIARRKNDRWEGTVVPRHRRLSVTFRLRRRPAAS